MAKPYADREPDARCCWPISTTAWAEKKAEPAGGPTHDEDGRLIEGAGVEELAPADLRAVNVGDVEDLERFWLIVISLPGSFRCSRLPEALENGLFDRARRKTVAYADHVVAVVGQLVQQAGVGDQGLTG